MKKVTIKALAGEHNAKDINILDGIDVYNADNEFIQYNDDEYASRIESGYMSFKVEDGHLYTLTEYVIIKDLTDEELQKLADYTQGQWGDGIGEGFEQFPCCEEDGEEIYLSPWFRGQKLEIIVE